MFDICLWVNFSLFLQNFHERVLEKADIIQATGDAIVTLPDVACLTPRYCCSVILTTLLTSILDNTDYKT